VLSCVSASQPGVTQGLSLCSDCLQPSTPLDHILPHVLPMYNTHPLYTTHQSASHTHLSRLILTHVSGTHPYVSHETNKKTKKTQNKKTHKKVRHSSITPHIHSSYVSHETNKQTNKNKQQGSPLCCWALPSLSRGGCLGNVGRTSASSSRQSASMLRVAAECNTQVPTGERR
jgi:hypothetical protein